MINDVTINISSATRTVSSESFGMPLILATNATLPYKEYSSLNEVVVDYATNTNAYKIASAIFAQNPSPAKIAIIGQIYASTANVFANYETSLTGTDNNLKFTSKRLGVLGNHVKIKYTNPAVSTDATTVAVTGTGTSGDPYIIDVTLRYTTAIVATANEVKLAIRANTQAKNLVVVENKTGENGLGIVTQLLATSLSGGTDGTVPTILTTILDNLILTKNTWYYLLSDTHNTNDIIALSSWATINKRLYVAVTADKILCQSPLLNSNYTAVIYHDVDSDFADAAWVGYGSAMTVGAITWKFKSLVGIKESSIKDEEVALFQANNINSYVNKHGRLQTSEGLTTAGTYIDDVVGKDWIISAMAQKINDTLYTSPKVPYNNIGIGMILADVLTVLRIATQNGIIDRADDGSGIYSATAPKKTEISSADIAARKLTGISFNFTKSGAVHTVNITGIEY